jgi:uncharacterized protein
MDPIRRIIFDAHNLEHIGRHGIGREEVLEACFPTRFLIRGRAKTRTVLGQCADGRYLTVILAPRGQGAYYVVTARNMTSSERRRYRAHTK